MAEETRYRDIFMHLQNNGVDVYSPAQKTGECTSPYVVLKGGGTTQYQQFSTVQDMYELLCYVPQATYSQLDIFVARVELLMKELAPMIRSSHYRTPPYYDDFVKAYMTSIQYYNFRKL